MKKIFAVVIVAVLLALPLHVIAQEPLPDINGTYDITGSYQDGADPYTGTATYTGTGSVYLFNGQYSFMTEPFVDPALLIGNTIVSSYAYPGTTCSETAYVRDEEGMLIGMWLDPTNNNGTGVEVLTPTAPTTDWVGSYTIHGLYPSGIPYHGTVDIQLNADGSYALSYNYPADGTNPALVTTGVALASENMLGVAINLDPAAEPGSCSLYISDFQADGSYNSVWYEGGRFGTETGTRR